MSAKKSALFTKLPERAVVWDGLSFFQRLLGSELFREFQEEEHVIAGDWKRLVCMRLAVPGADRGNVSRALDGMLEAGVIVLGEGTFRLLYSTEAVRSHRRPAQPRPMPDPPPAPGRLGSGSGPAHARPMPGSGPAPGRAGSGYESSSRDDSTVSGEIEDREIDRRRVRAHAGEVGQEETGSEPSPERLRWELEELVRAEFFARGTTPQKAAQGQWLDGCKTVQEALAKGQFPDAHAAMQAFATALVDAIAEKKPPALGLALRSVQLGAQLKPALAGGRQLSALALATLERRRAGEGA